MCIMNIAMIVLMAACVSLGHEVAGEVTLKHIYEIAVVKSRDPAFARLSLEQICRVITGSARSLGIKILTEKN